MMILLKTCSPFIVLQPPYTHVPCILSQLWWQYVVRINHNRRPNCLHFVTKILYIIIIIMFQTKLLSTYFRPEELYLLSWWLQSSTASYTGKKPTFQFLMKCDFQRPFSDWNVLNGRHISVTIQLTFIANSVAFQSPISNSPLKK